MPRALRRAGARRRPPLLLLSCFVVVGLTAGAGYLTMGTRAPPTPGPAPPGQSRPPPAGTEPVTSAELLGVGALGPLRGSVAWQVASTGSGPSATITAAPCLPMVSAGEGSWTWERRYRSGAGVHMDQTVTQTVVAAESTARATKAFDLLAHAIANCRGHHLVGYSRAGAVADDALLVRLRFVAPSQLGTRVVALARSGRLLTVLDIRTPVGRAPAPAAVTDLLGAALDRLCPSAAGGCPSPPYPVTAAPLPGDGVPGPFLSVVDLPLFGAVPTSWAGTDALPVRRNPAATACDRADFDAAGAAKVVARSYVVPRSRTLPAVFGLTETVGTFVTAAAARRFLATVSTSVARCHQREVTLRVLASSPLRNGSVRGKVWRIGLRTSSSDRATFRVALLQVGRTAAEVTFTPSATVDVGRHEFAVLAERAGRRLVLG
jgi:hypothetical protein